MGLGATTCAVMSGERDLTTDRPGDDRGHPGLPPGVHRRRGRGRVAGRRRADLLARGTRLATRRGRAGRHDPATRRGAATGRRPCRRARRAARAGAAEPIRDQPHQHGRPGHGDHRGRRLARPGHLPRHVPPQHRGARPRRRDPSRRPPDRACPGLRDGSRHARVRIGSTGRGSSRRSPPPTMRAPSASSRSRSTTPRSPARHRSGAGWRRSQDALAMEGLAFLRRAFARRLRCVGSSSSPARPSHAAGVHEFRAGARLLARCLASVPDLVVEVLDEGRLPDLTGGRPSAVVVFSDGGPSHPLLEDDRLAALDALARRGSASGSCTTPWRCPRTTARRSSSAGSAGRTRTASRAIRSGTPTSSRRAAHPITRGVAPFTMLDEWYFGLTFRRPTAVVQPILVATPSDDGPRRAVRLARRPVSAHRGRQRTARDADVGDRAAGRRSGVRPGRRALPRQLGERRLPPRRPQRPRLGGRCGGAAVPAWHRRSRPPTSSGTSMGAA